MLGGLDFYLSVVRGLLFRLRHGTVDGYKHVSGFPAVGTFLVTVAALLDFGSLPFALLGLATLALDTGGLPWFAVAMWRDASLRES